MQELYDLAFARLERVPVKRREFAQCWAKYISVHPWDIDVRNGDPSTLEIFAVMREPAPAELALIFSEWLAALPGFAGQRDLRAGRRNHWPESPAAS